MARYSPLVFCSRALCLLPLLVVGVGADCSLMGFPHYSSSIPGTTTYATIAEDACKTACLDADTCVGLLYDSGGNPNCRLYTTEPADLDGPDDLFYNTKTYYNKSCTPETTTTIEAPTTTTTIVTSETTTTIEAPTTTTTVVTSDSCMASSSDQGSSTQLSVALQATQDTCKTLCKAALQCRAFSFGGSTGSTCIIHTSGFTNSTDSEYVFASKHACSDDTDCCFNKSSANTKGTSSGDTSLELNDPAESCKQMCVAGSSCVAVTISGTTCRLHDSVQSGSGQASSSFYTKTCSGGGMTFESTCRLVLLFTALL